MRRPTSAPAESVLSAMFGTFDFSSQNPSSPSSMSRANEIAKAFRSMNEP
jgi:hypothetical protein